MATRLKNLKVFGSWLDCGQPDYQLSVAVHETAHLLDIKLSDPLRTKIAYDIEKGHILFIYRMDLFPMSELVVGKASFRK